MAIEIKFEEFLKEGLPYVKILKVKALKKNQLPNRYLSKPPFVYMFYFTNMPGQPDCCYKFKNDTPGLQYETQNYYGSILEGQEIKKKEFFHILKKIRKAGKRLSRINKIIKKTKNVPSTKKTIII